MGLERVFKAPWTLRKLRSGPLGAMLGEFCGWLLEQGFSSNTVRKHLTSVGRLNAWLSEEGRQHAHGLSQSDVDRFLEAHRSCLQRVRGSIRRFVEYLSQKGLFDPLPANPPHHAVLDDYLAWMREQRHAAEGTLDKRRRSVKQFLEWLGVDATPEELSQLSAERIESFFLDYASETGLWARRSMQAGLRTFLGFCFHKGYVPHHLQHAVPRLRAYRLARVPHGLRPMQAQAIVESVDRGTDMGRRDYAILTMLHTYGVRGCQIRGLQLNDIRWSHDQILFRATKRGKDCLFPLTQQVGESLLDYLQNVRPRCAFPEVFLTCQAPHRPLARPSTLSSIVRKYVHRAGVEAPRKGSHLFRHTLATRLVGEGQSLKTVADVLGHRRLSTTFIYTKVDFPALSQVALEWPGEVVS
jgi:site-specific recombinase XerD